MSDTTHCKNCAAPVIDKYCSNCGQPKLLKRVDGHYLAHEIQHILHFEKGIFYTVKELLIRPGKNVREFIADNRDRLVKPVAFIVITSLIYSTINHLFHVEEGFVSYKGLENSAIGKIMAWVEGHYGYANIIMGVFIALWVKLFFKKYNYNFFEILILLCFVMGIGMLIVSVFTIAEALVKVKMMKASAFIWMSYCTWAIAQFFSGRKVSDYVKSLFAYILGMLSASIAALSLGVLIDVFFKH